MNCKNCHNLYWAASGVNCSFWLGLGFLGGFLNSGMSIMTQLHFTNALRVTFKWDNCCICVTPMVLQQITSGKEPSRSLSLHINMHMPVCDGRGTIWYRICHIQHEFTGSIRPCIIALVRCSIIIGRFRFTWFTALRFLPVVILWEK